MVRYIHPKKSGLRRELERAAKAKGSPILRVASVEDMDALPRVWIEWGVDAYTKKLRSKMPDSRSLIVFGVPSVDHVDELEVRRPDGRFDYPGYHALWIVSRALIDLLRKKGFKATTPPSYISLKNAAQLSGLGRYGKNSLVLNPEFGPWLRVGAVLTDAELSPDEPLDWDPCGDCTRCLRACPTEAIEPYVVTPEKCLVAVSEMKRIPARYAKLLSKHAPLITPSARVMCTACQMECPHTGKERRRNVLARR